MKAKLPPPVPPSQPPAPPAPAPTAAPDRRKWLRPAAVVVALVLVSGAVGWWWRTRPAAPPEPPQPTDVADEEVRAALDKARATVVADKWSAEAWGHYGSTLLAHQLDRDADRCFAVAAQRDSDDPRWPYARGLVALKAEPDRAVPLMQTAADLSRTKPVFRAACALTLAEALFERGQTDSAAALFEQELAVAPGTDRAAFGLGSVAEARGDAGAAEARFRAVRRNPCCRRQANARLARLALARGDADAARGYEAEANALDTDPPWPDPFLDKVANLLVGARGLARRADLLVRDGRYREAADLYLRQANVGGASREYRCRALTGAAVNLLRAGDIDRATERARAAVAADGDDAKARYTLALALFNRAEPLWVADPTSGDAARMFREAGAEARKATELKPDHSQAFLFWGLSLKNLGDPRAALEPLRKGLAIHPGEFETCLALGQALAATGDRPGAERHFQLAAQIDPSDPRPPRELAKLK